MKTHTRAPGRESGPRARSRRGLALLAALMMPLAGAGALAAPAAAVPVVPASTTQTALAQTVNVRAANGHFALMRGVVDPVRDRLYIADATGPSGAWLTVIDLKTGLSSLIALAGPSSASGVAVSPLDGTVYVTHNTLPPSAVSVVDPDATYTDAVRPPQVVLPQQNPERIQIGADGRVYILHGYDRIVNVLGASTGPDRLNLVQSLALPGGDGESGFIRDAAGDRLIVADEPGKGLIVVDSSVNPAVLGARIDMSFGPHSIAVDPASGGILATNAADNTLNWLGATPGTGTAPVLRTETLGAFPDGAEPWSDQRAIVPRVDGSVEVLTRVWPVTLNSFLSVVPPVVNAENPVRTLNLGRGPSDLIDDPRAGGARYVLTAGGLVHTLTDVTLTADASTRALGAAGEYRALVSRADGRPAAGLSVDFGNGLSAVTDAAGIARVPAPERTIGQHSFTATLALPALAPLSATATAEITRAQPVVTLGLDRAEAVAGESARATVSVTGVAEAAAGGTVRLLDAKNAVRGTASLSAGTASINVTGLTAGDTELRAEYLGDDSYLPGTSAPARILVSAPANPSLIPSVVSAAPGAEVRIELRDFLPGERVSVTMHSDPVLLGTVTMDERGAGVLIARIPTVTPGAHTIIAVGETSGRITRIPFTVESAALPAAVDAGPRPAGLAATGANLAGAGVLAALLLAAGVLTSMRVRRRG